MIWCDEVPYNSTPHPVVLLFTSFLNLECKYTLLISASTPTGLLKTVQKHQFGAIIDVLPLGFSVFTVDRSYGEVCERRRCLSSDDRLPFPRQDPKAGVRQRCGRD